MKKKTIVKIVLDVVMVVVLALMYSKNALGLSFHEIGGLAVIGAFLIHNLLNFKWITSVTSRLRKANGRTRLAWIVDALMLVAFLLIGISGVFISKVVFPTVNGGGPWKTIHYTAAAVALVLVGVHLGLHASYLKGIFGRMIRLPRVVGIALVCILVGFGAYSAATTSFSHWLALPFASSAQGGGQNFAEREDAGTGDATGDQANGEGKGMRDGAGEGQGLNGAGGHEEGGAVSARNALKTFASYFSIAFLFAAIVAYIEKTMRWIKKRHFTSTPIPAPEPN